MQAIYLDCSICVFLFFLSFFYLCKKREQHKHIYTSILGLKMRTQKSLVRMVPSEKENSIRSEEETPTFHVMCILSHVQLFATSWIVTH